MARPGIMIYFDMQEPLKVLSDEDVGRLFRAMLEYGEHGVVPEFDGMLALAWGFVKPKLDKDEDNYENSRSQRTYAAFCKRRAAAGLSKIPFEKWNLMDANERKRALTDDNEPEREQRAVNFVASRYPSTATTTTATAAAATPTSTSAPTSTPSSTSSSTSTPAAAATPTTPTTFADGEAAAAAERKLKILNGELGKGVVKLSPYQIDLLLDQLGVELFDHYVSRLANFIINNGASVKNHYATILKWWTEDSSVD